MISKNAFPNIMGYDYAHVDDYATRLSAVAQDIARMVVEAPKGARIIIDKHADPSTLPDNSLLTVTLTYEH